MLIPACIFSATHLCRLIVEPRIQECIEMITWPIRNSWSCEMEAVVILILYRLSLCVCHCTAGNLVMKTAVQPMVVKVGKESPPLGFELDMSRNMSRANSSSEGEKDALVEPEWDLPLTKHHGCANIPSHFCSFLSAPINVCFYYVVLSFIILIAKHLVCSVLPILDFKCGEIPYLSKYKHASLMIM